MTRRTSLCSEVHRLVSQMLHAHLHGDAFVRFVSDDIEIIRLPTVNATSNVSSYLQGWKRARLALNLHFKIVKRRPLVEDGANVEEEADVPVE